MVALAYKVSYIRLLCNIDVTKTVKIRNNCFNFYKIKGVKHQKSIGRKINYRKIIFARTI